MKWIKYRLNWASSLGKWEYYDLDTGYFNINDFIDDKNNQNNWSDKYRGCEVIENVQPPVEILEKEIDKLHKNIVWAESQIYKYNELKNKLKKEGAPQRES